jgi:hypothetical protein
MFCADAIGQTQEDLAKVLILVKTGIQFLVCPRELLDSRLRRNDV